MWRWATIPTAPAGSRSSASRPPKATKAAAAAAARTAGAGREVLRFTTEAQRQRTQGQNKQNLPNDVITAKAGIHLSTSESSARWIPAFAGMTVAFLFLWFSALSVSLW